MPPAEPRDKTRVDPLLPTGIVFASLGAVLLLSGVPLLASDDGDQVCGVTGGCVTRPDPDRELAGGAILGSGLGLVAMGVPVAIGGAGEIAREGHRHSNGMLTTGVVLTTVAAGMLGGAFGAMVADAGRGRVDGLTVLMPIFVVAGSLPLAGVPLWAVGARKPTGVDADGGPP